MTGGNKRYTVNINNKNHQVDLINISGNTVSFEIAGNKYSATVNPHTNCTSFINSNTPISQLNQTSSNISKSVQPSNTNAKDIYAPMPGLVVSVAVKSGDKVEIGSKALVLEAMKMENGINFSQAGTVKEVLVKAGDQVESGQLLVSLNE